MKRIDEKIEKLGFQKEKEDKYGVMYISKDEKYGFTQCVNILHKQSGEHIIQSYEMEVNNDGYNNCVGITLKEMKLFLKKAKQLKRKYKW